ncbi:hypothetical protein [Bradyrhizobium sp. NAS80.1]|uniref:hypothetical protein n=1 Tax=Bradyrhizobium sp. NAS80.1 TaxID=1680159 RepID=UPI000B0106A1|nr:hypothetical protein [Bradyrhizobium sp. NAS80.1]
MLLLLCAADWVLPAPLPSRSAAADRAMPPIRIHSDVKGPELVVIDTNQPARAVADKDIAAFAHLENADAADAVQEPISLASVDGSESRPATSMTSRVRESLAQSIADHDGARAMAEPRRTSAHARSGKRRRAAGHLRPSGTLGRCNAFSGGACRAHTLVRRLDDLPF